MAIVSTHRPACIQTTDLDGEPRCSCEFVDSFNGAPALFGTYRATRVFFGGCPDCGGTESIDGEWSTGETLINGYTPTVGELVKNHERRCGRCGRQEWS